MNRGGHGELARISTTTIYTDASGDEEAAFAARFRNDLEIAQEGKGEAARLR